MDGIIIQTGQRQQYIRRLKIDYYFVLYSKLLLYHTTPWSDARSPSRHSLMYYSRCESGVNRS